MSERDPRLDPRPGDVIAAKGASRGARRVVYATLTGKVVYDVEHSRIAQRVCTASTWRKWARGGRVCAVAGGESEPSTVAPNIPRAVYFQINGLANAWGRTLKKGVSTPWNETFLALLELGLEAALEPGPGLRALHAALDRHVPHEDDRRRPTT